MIYFIHSRSLARSALCSSFSSLDKDFRMRGLRIWVNTWTNTLPTSPWTMNYDDEWILDVYMGPVVVTNTSEQTFYFSNILTYQKWGSDFLIIHIFGVIRNIILILQYMVFSSFAYPSSYAIPPLSQTWLHFHAYRIM